MEAHYIHTEQLVESRNNVVSAAQPLTTFISWVLFAPKDRVTSGIGVIEAKGKLVIQETGMEPEGLVDYLVSRILMTFLNYKPLSRTFKSVLLSRINSYLDKLLSRTMKDRSGSETTGPDKTICLHKDQPIPKKPVVVVRRRKKANADTVSETDSQWSFVDICQ